MDLWDAINGYAESCGGDTSNRTISPSRMDAVVAVETELTVKLAEQIGYLERGVHGATEGVYPDWVYEARESIRHANASVPWLADLHAALGWQGGTIHQALQAVRRLVAAETARERD